MSVTTEHRDAWAEFETSECSSNSPSAAAVVQEISRGSFALDKLMQAMTKAASFREFYSELERLAELSRSVSYNVHNLKLLCDFLVPPATLFNDHYINQFFLMSAMKRTFWVEGPAFCGFAIKPGSQILELGCGMGYYTDVFFAPFASEIVAIDIDPRAIETARRRIRQETSGTRSWTSERRCPKGLST